MGCYTIPLAAAILVFAWRKMKGDSSKKLWLNLLLGGGAVFGVVDHAWNNELLAFSLSDFTLGVVITLSIVALWGFAFALPVKAPVRAKTVN